ncbi:hypothetical protein BDE02_01G142900 [Populus trichocarpa]|nr:hypothetical protein BDE02_01G142900 [Populus trichocarpa]
MSSAVTVCGGHTRDRRQCVKQGLVRRRMCSMLLYRNLQKTRQERPRSWWNTILIIVGFIWADLRLCGEDGCFVLVLGERLSVSIREERDRFMVACLWSGGGCCYFFANMIMGD